MDNKIYLVITSKDELLIDNSLISAFTNKLSADIELFNRYAKFKSCNTVLKEVNLFSYNANDHVNEIALNSIKYIITFIIDILEPTDQKYITKCIDPFDTILFIAKPIQYRPTYDFDIQTGFETLFIDRSGYIFLPNDNTRAFATFIAKANVILPYEDISLTNLYKKAFDQLKQEFDKTIKFNHKGNRIFHKYLLELEGV